MFCTSTLRAPNFMVTWLFSVTPVAYPISTCYFWQNPKPVFGPGMWYNYGNTCIYLHRFIEYLGQWSKDELMYHIKTTVFYCIVLHCIALHSNILHCSSCCSEEDSNFFRRMGQSFSWWDCSFENHQTWRPYPVHLWAWNTCRPSTGHWVILLVSLILKNNFASSN